MSSNYNRDIFRQLTEALEKLDTLVDKNDKLQRDLKLHLQNEANLTGEISKLTEKVADMMRENADLQARLSASEKLVELLLEDNERMKRNLNNDSNNSSIPPSKNPPGKPANHYNSRKSTDKKQGGQPGHKGSGLSKAEIEKKIADGLIEHRIEKIGDPKGKYITRYRLDLEIKATATEIRIYADKNGKFQIPNDLQAEVTYGNNLKAIAAFLYSEGVVSIDRICTFINSISGDAISVSPGSVYAFCQKFAGACHKEASTIQGELLNAHEIRTDATPVTTNGKQTYIRNFSTENSVLYCSSDKKNLETLKKFEILNQFTGIFTHDHETALYHFGRGHGECNVHLLRYLTKNSEETGNQWSTQMKDFLTELNELRNSLIRQGTNQFPEEQLNRFSQRYDDILTLGIQENEKTSGKVASEDELKLLNRLKKYKDNHLLFLYDFQVHFSNNMSEKDLRICKNRQKMAGGFRTPDGRNMYCEIMSVIETVKRRKQNIYQSIVDLMAGKPVIT